MNYSQYEVKKSDGVTNVVYSSQSINGTEAVFIDSTSSMSAPRLLKIKNNNKAVGAVGTDRHTIQVQHVVLDSAEKPQVITCDVTWSIPRSAAITDTLCKDVLVAALQVAELAGVQNALIDGRFP